MIDGRKILIVIPARGGSKRLSNKNIRLLSGKPLISYVITAAKKVPNIDALIVSTDSRKIAKIAIKYGADTPFMRPDSLSTDKAKSVDVLIHAVKKMEEIKKVRFDQVLLLQPTSPLIQSIDILKLIQTLNQSKSNSCVTVTPIKERPEWMLKFNNKGKLANFLNRNNSQSRSQDLPSLFRLNGAGYCVSRSILIKKGRIIDYNNLSAVVMPFDRSVDIDDKDDLKLAEFFLNKISKK